MVVIVLGNPKAAMSIYYCQITTHITAAAVPLILHKNFAQIISEFFSFLDPGAIDIQYREYFLHQIMSRRGRVETCLWIRKPQSPGLTLLLISTWE